MRGKIKKLPLDPPPDDALKVSKKHAACAELATAIRLFFEGKDFLSAHVLANAARDVLQGLAKAKALKPARQQFKERIIPEYQDAIMDLMTAPYNFMKHSGRDAGATYDRFSPEQTALAILEACMDFAIVFPGEAYLEICLFTIWMAQRYPGILKQEFAATVSGVPSLRAEPEAPLPQALKEAAELLRAADSFADCPIRSPFPLLRAAGQPGR